MWSIFRMVFFVIQSNIGMNYYLDPNQINNLDEPLSYEELFFRVSPASERIYGDTFLPVGVECEITHPVLAPDCDNHQFLKAIAEDFMYESGFAFSDDEQWMMLVVNRGVYNPQDVFLIKLK